MLKTKTSRGQDISVCSLNSVNIDYIVSIVYIVL